MIDKRRAQWLAATLIVAIIGVMVVRSMADPDPPPAAAARPAARARPGVAPVNQIAELASVDVNLQVLTRPRGEPADQGRNPFRFRPAPPPRPPDPLPRPSVRPGTGPVGGGNQSPAPVIPPAPVGPPPPPPITLKFIGIIEKADGTKIAVLSDGRATYPGVEGQEIAGRYKILRVGVESIEVSYIDGRGRQTIRLTGQ